MRKVVAISLALSCLTFVSSLLVLFSLGEFISVVSWVIVGLSAVHMIVLLSLYIEAKKQEKELRAKIAHYKLVHKLREKAIYDFYNKFGLKPQYNKDGRLLTPDEYLGILTKLNAEGKLDPSIYEMLGILPRFDERGKEIPQILVLKHLLKELKKEGFSDIPKLKGLYKKGTKKEAEKKPEKKKEESKKEEKKAGGKKGKGKNKINLWGGKLLEFKLKEVKQDKKSGANKKSEVKAPSNIAPKPEVKPEPKIEKVVVQAPKPEPRANTSSYVNKMFSEGSQTQGNKKPIAQNETIEEYGEATFE